MFCHICGTEIPEESQFCQKCGRPQGQQNAALVHNSSLVITPSNAPQSAAIAKPAKEYRTSILVLCKRIGWRATAAYLWLKLLLDGLLDSTPCHSLEKLFSQRWTDYLSSIGFTPVNPRYMLPILKLSWLLIITGVSFWQFLGFWLYVLAFPATIVFLIVFRKQLHQSRAQSQTSSNKSQQTQQRRGFLGIAIGLNIAWFLLFGSTLSIRPMAFGVLFAGLFFVSLSFRAFKRARPVKESDVTFGAFLDRQAMQAVSDKTRLKPETKSAAGISLKFEEIYKSLLMAFLCLFSGKRGRERATMYILVEYVSFLILLAFSAIMFWGMSIRLTTPLSIQDSFLLSASHFLPGLSITSPVATALPIWTQVGPALTAWILFVLFVGPAASLLPARQAIYANQIEFRCRTFCKYVAKINRRIKTICQLRDSLNN